MDLGEMTKPSCKATVQLWQSSSRKFLTLPPTFDESEELYKKQKNVSFLALYNADPNAEGDCRVATCTQEAEKTKGADPKTRTALLCLTSPNLLASGATPFT